MAEKKVRLQVITPEGIKLDEKTDMVIMRCDNGDMGILPNHEARSAILDYGILRIFDGGNERRVAVYGGVAEILNNTLTILTQEAHLPGDIDLKQAEADRDYAEQKLREKPDNLQAQRNQVLLRRALTQIKLASSAN